MTRKNIKIKIELSKRIFCFYALLNFLDYNPEASSIHPMRKKVRIFLKHTIPGKDFKDSKEIIKQEDLRKEFWFPLRTWILCHGQPPNFIEKSCYWKKFLDIQTGKEFCQQLKSFWKLVFPLWKIIRRDYSKIIQKCLSNAKIAVESSLSYLRLEKTDIKEFIVIPNFLEEYDRGIGPKIGKSAYALLGPSIGNDPFPVRRIQHEFLHSIINPMTHDVLGNIVKKGELSLIREYLIHAIILRSHRFNKLYYKNKITTLKKLKFKNIEKVLVILKDYELSQKNFREFVRNNKIKIKKACL